MPIATTQNRIYKGCNLGFLIRKSIGKDKIFRVRPGNGKANTKTGYFYQDQYDYFVPDSINNAESQTGRDLFASAVLRWQTTVTPEQKTLYNKRARRKNVMSGYNLFIREVLLGRV